MALPKETRIASICWEGDSWDVLKSWPKAIQWDFGNSLREMQYGRPAKLDVRPMQSIDKGVFELKDSDDKTWYRMLYLSRVADVIYSSGLFSKNTAKTERKDLNTASARLSGAVMLSVLPEGHLQERVLAGVLVEHAGQECPGHRVIAL